MKRLTISLEDDLHQELFEWAEEEDRSVSNLLSYLAKQAIREKREKKPLSKKAS